MIVGDAPITPERFPFDVEFQKGLLRLLCEDSRFAHLIAAHLQPTHFENEVLSWAWSWARRFREEYGAFPTLHTIKQQTFRMDPRLRPIYELTLEQVEHATLKDEVWLRDQVLDFVKRNIFVAAFHQARLLYNKDQTDKAYDYMMGEMERINKTIWTVADEGWFFDELPDRQVRHMANDAGARSIATGFDKLDWMMHGGLSKGELGIWVAYAKGGKSTMLMTHGVAATKLQLRNTAHFVFEGSRPQVEDRYEAAFNAELYTQVRNGGLTSEGYRRAYQEYQLCKGKLYIRGFTEEWNYSVVDIHTALKDLKRSHGWVPDLIIVDYGDLLSGRESRYNSEREKQKAAFRDLKSLANRGYAVWSASQAQRPAEGAESTAHWIWSRMIADCYEKVRVADFIGSLNACEEERKAKIMRILGELYRDNAADCRFCVACDLAKMMIRDDPTAVSRPMPDLYAHSMGVQRAQAKSLPPASPVVPPPQSQPAYQTTAPLKTP